MVSMWFLCLGGVKPISSVCGVYSIYIRWFLEGISDLSADAAWMLLKIRSALAFYKVCSHNNAEVRHSLEQTRVLIKVKNWYVYINMAFIIIIWDTA